MYARAGVPGVLHERDVLVGEKMGSLEDQARWTLHGAVAWAARSP
jgi:hypothetical protein